MNTSTMSKEAVKSLQTLVRVGLALGVAASMAANVSFAVADSTDRPAWMIAIRVFASALMPLGLFWCIEMVIRIPATSKWRSAIRIVATTGIGGFAGWVSYWHMHDILVLVGEPVGTARFIPGAIDGAMAVGTISMIELERTARNIAAVEQARRIAEQAELDAEAEAEKTQAREARKVSTDEQDARDAVRYDKLDRAAKSRFTKVYRTEGADAAIRQFRGRRRKPNAPAAAQVSPGMPPVTAPSVDAVKQIVNA